MSAPRSPHSAPTRVFVYLELADATPAETSRGMALITKLVG